MHGFGGPVDGGDTDAFVLSEGVCDEWIEVELSWEGGIGEDGGCGRVEIGLEEMGCELIAQCIATRWRDGFEGRFDDFSEIGFGGAIGHDRL